MITVYVEVNDSDGPFNINILTMGEYFSRSFRIKITQLKMGDELVSPRNCLQYYTSPNGFVQSFNYRKYYLEDFGKQNNGYFVRDLQNFLYFKC
mgnify:FL=1